MNNPLPVLPLFRLFCTQFSFEMAGMHGFVRFSAAPHDVPSPQAHQAQPNAFAQQQQNAFAQQHALAQQQHAAALMQYMPGGGWMHPGAAPFYYPSHVQAQQLKGHGVTEEAIRLQLKTMVEQIKQYTEQLKQRDDEIKARDKSVELATAQHTAATVEIAQLKKQIVELRSQLMEVDKASKAKDDQLASLRALTVNKTTSVDGQLLQEQLKQMNDRQEELVRALAIVADKQLQTQQAKAQAQTTPGTVMAQAVWPQYQPMQPMWSPYMPKDGVQSPAHVQAGAGGIYSPSPYGFVTAVSPGFSAFSAPTPVAAPVQAVPITETPAVGAVPGALPNIGAALSIGASTATKVSAPETKALAVHVQPKTSAGHEEPNRAASPMTPLPPPLSISGSGTGTAVCIPINALPESKVSDPKSVKNNDPAIVSAVLASTPATVPVLTTNLSSKPTAAPVAASPMPGSSNEVKSKLQEDRAKAQDSGKTPGGQVRSVLTTSLIKGSVMGGPSPMRDWRNVVNKATGSPLNNANGSSPNSGVLRPSTAPMPAPTPVPNKATAIGLGCYFVPSTLVPTNHIFTPVREGDDLNAAVAHCHACDLKHVLHASECLEITCTECKRKGHYAAVCGASTTKCQACGDPGHTMNTPFCRFGTDGTGGNSLVHGYEQWWIDYSKGNAICRVRRYIGDKTNWEALPKGFSPEAFFQHNQYSVMNVHPDAAKQVVQQKHPEGAAAKKGTTRYYDEDVVAELINCPQYDPSHPMAEKANYMVYLMQPKRK
jgi:hypothetical protein